LEVNKLDLKILVPANNLFGYCATLYREFQIIWIIPDITTKSKAVIF
jgi:hypothetical protein